MIPDLGVNWTVDPLIRHIHLLFVSWLGIFGNH